MNKKQLKMVRDHTKRMWDMRFSWVKWQEIHQKRWDEVDKCTNDTCGCEAIYYKNKGILFFDGVNNAIN